MHIHWLDYSYILILLQLLTHLSFSCRGGCVLLSVESGIAIDWCIKALWVALWDSQFNLKHSCEQKYVLIPFSVHLGHKNEALSLVQPLPEQNRFFSFLFLGIVGGRSCCCCGGGLIRSYPCFLMYLMFSKPSSVSIIGLTLVYIMWQ